MQFGRILAAGRYDDSVSNETLRQHRHLAAAAALWGAGALLAAHALAAPAFDTRPVAAALARLLPQQAAQLELRTLDSADGHERLRISGNAGRVRIEGGTPSALFFGANWYLKYVAHLHFSESGDQTAAAGSLPVPTTVIEMETPYPWRYALNENVDGYSAPYWDFAHWQRELDFLALSGINALLLERGTDMVLYRTFRDFGYSDAEIRAWITEPAHQNWQLMGNLCCFNGPISRALLVKRAASARRIVARLRELGITPVLPGFYGIVPQDFRQRFPAAHVIAQGEWAGFTRPDWLDPRDPLFARLAASFYRHQRELFGDTTIYDMEVFQEGGDPGDVPVAPAARAVQAALLASHPGARWMMLAWQGNPRAELLAGVDRTHLLIIDIDHDRVPRDDRQHDFEDAPFLFGGIWEFGGRTTLGANVDNITTRLQRLARTNTNMAGTALFTEGMGTNPFALDLFTEMAWRAAPLDLGSWARHYAQRRYGADDPHAVAAWKVLTTTAYDIRIDDVVFNSERDAAQESLFDAQPSLTAQHASNWSPEGMRYDAAAFRQALAELLRSAPRSPGGTHDLVDVARQTLANESRVLLPQIAAAYTARDRARFGTLTARWLHLMDLEDELLATDRTFLLGTWLSQVAPWASTPAERVRLEYDARSLLTTWGDRKASEDAKLHDYGNRDWAGLTRDYYRARWERYFRSLDEELRTGQAAPPIDWFAIGEAWNRDTRSYPDQPRGDPYEVAGRVARELGIER
jgi:alpha-N-acetylglucosaminidase